MIILTLILANAVCSFPIHSLVSQNLDSNLDKMYTSYFTFPDIYRNNGQINAIPYAPNIFNKNIAKHKMFFEKPAFESKRAERTAYFRMLASQQEKRYTSALTLCHFKICNMGRKRAFRVTTNSYSNRT